MFASEWTSRGAVERDRQRVTEVNGKSAKPESHTHPPLLPPSHAFVQSPSPRTHPPRCGGVLGAHPSIPAVVLDHVGQLDDELAFFVLLTALEGMFLQGVAEDRRDIALS